MLRTLSLTESELSGQASEYGRRLGHTVSRARRFVRTSSVFVSASLRDVSNPDHLEFIKEPKADWNGVERDED